MNYILLVAIFWLTGFKASGQDKTFKNWDGKVYHGERAIEVFHQCSRPAPAKVKQLWVPDQSHVDSINKHLPSLYALAVPVIKGGAPWAAQYFGFIRDGKKLIYLNVYRGDDSTKIEYSSTNPVNICDGWGSVWGAVFDPDTGVFSEFYANGIRQVQPREKKKKKA